MEVNLKVSQRDPPDRVGDDTVYMKHRLLRVNEVLKRELSGLITREMKFEQGSRYHQSGGHHLRSEKRTRLCQRPWDDGRKT